VVVEVVNGISVSPDEGVLMFGCPGRRFCRCEGSLIDEHADRVHKIRPFPEPSCVESGEFRVGDGKSRDFVNEFTDYRLPAAVLEDRQEKAVERALPRSRDIANRERRISGDLEQPDPVTFYPQWPAQMLLEPSVQRWFVFSRQVDDGGVGSSPMPQWAPQQSPDDFLLL
jgi:hypothetical protein